MSDQNPPTLDAASGAVGPAPTQDLPPLPSLPSVPDEVDQPSGTASASDVAEIEPVDAPTEEGTPESREEPDVLAALSRTQEAVEQQLERHSERLKEAFDTKLAVDQVKDKQIDALHREVQQHKRDLLAKAMRPLISGLVRLHDNLGRSAESFDGAEQSPSANEVSQLLAEFQEDVEMLLEDNGVVLFSEPVEQLEPRRQTVRKTIPCPDSVNVGDIARRVRPGFERDGQVLQKERVDVYVAAPTT